MECGRREEGGNFNKKLNTIKYIKKNFSKLNKIRRKKLILKNSTSGNLKVNGWNLKKFILNEVTQTQNDK